MNRTGRVITLATIVAVALATGVGRAERKSDPGKPKELVLYSGRSQSLVEPLLEKYRAQTGVKISVKYGSSAQLAIALQEEGDRSPADLFWSQDAGALGAIGKSGLFAKLPDDVVAAVPPSFRDAKSEWVATSGRARVLAYSPVRVSAAELPRSVFDLADRKWRGRVGWSPLNASFQSFVTAMYKVHGVERTTEWLTAVKKNEAKAYPQNTAIIEAIAAGEIDVGLPNHYYLLRFKKADPAFPVEQTFFAAHDIGNLINVAGVGVLRTSRHREQAEQFVRYLLSADAQRYFVGEVFEYPVVEGEFENPALMDMDRLIDLSPAVELNDLDKLNETLDLLRKVGLL
jgi:iron(III) transport system substrate-binding protein